MEDDEIVQEYTGFLYLGPLSVQVNAVLLK